MDLPVHEKPPKLKGKEFMQRAKTLRTKMVNIIQKHIEVRADDKIFKKSMGILFQD